MDYFEVSYTVIGGLGVFFLGLMYLSEALQTGGRDTLRRILDKVTGHRLLAVLAGIGITAFVQSSSISTVMTVSLVNAGLMELRQGLGVILGANIGTTITGWIISIKVGSYGLLFIAIGILPMLAVSNTLINTIAKTLVALGLIFVGLEFMSGAMRPLRTDPAFISYLSVFDAETLRSLIACVAMGCLLTVIVQSSSAMLGITITLAATGVIEFDTAVALILGENIGTTITAQLAAIGANTSAVRAARGHAIFNIAGALLMIIIFPLYVQFIELIVPGQANALNAVGEHPNIALHIALAHTMFNCINVIIWIPLIDQLARLVCWLVPQKDEKEVHKLKYLGNPAHSAPEVSLQEARLELDNMVDITSELLNITREYVSGDQKNKKLFERIEQLEEITDNIEQEMIAFVTKIQVHSLSVDQSKRAYSYIRMADEIESIADCLQSMAIFRKRLFKKNEQLSEVAWNDLLGYFDEVSVYFRDIVAACEKRRAPPSVAQKLLAKSRPLTREAEALRDRHFDRITKGECSLLSAQTYNDMAIALRRMKNHSVNYLEAMTPV